jgi:hypothetical protein
MATKSGNRLGAISDVVVWTLLSGGAMVVAYELLLVITQSGVGLLLAFFFPPAVLLIVLVLLFGGPASVLIAGIRKRRLPMIVGPLLLVPIIAAYTVVSDWFEMRDLSKDVAALDVRAFSAPDRHHDLIILEHSASGDCDELCQRILVRTDYRVGIPAADSEPIVYRKISEAQCKDTWDSARNVRFSGSAPRWKGFNPSMMVF